MQRARLQFGPLGFSVVGIDVRDTRPKVAAFRMRTGYDWPSLYRYRRKNCFQLCNRRLPDNNPGGSRRPDPLHPGLRRRPGDRPRPPAERRAGDPVKPGVLSVRSSDHGDPDETRSFRRVEGCRRLHSCCRKVIPAYWMTRSTMFTHSGAMFGGLGGGEAASNDLCMAYNLISETWEILNSMPNRRFGVVAEVIGDRIRIAGGCTRLYYNLPVRVDIFDPAME